MPVATLIFLLVPLIEVIILIQVGSIIGVLPTVLLIVLTAVCGIWLLRAEGIATLMRVQSKLERGEIPDTELLEGVMLIIGGALLLTPGFATDAFGFVCLLPGLRRPLANRIIRSSVFRQIRPGTRFYRSSHTVYKDGEIIEGEFNEEEPDRDRLKQPKLDSDAR